MISYLLELVIFDDIENKNVKLLSMSNNHFNKIIKKNKLSITTNSNFGRCFSLKNISAIEIRCLGKKFSHPEMTFNNNVLEVSHCFRNMLMKSFLKNMNTKDNYIDDVLLEDMVNNHLIKLEQKIKQKMCINDTLMTTFIRYKKIKNPLKRKTYIWVEDK